MALLKWHTLPAIPRGSDGERPSPTRRETAGDEARLRRLRDLQDETRSFFGFIPLPYHAENNDIPVRTPPTGFDALRTIAVARAYLDNFDHITAY